MTAGINGLCKLLKLPVPSKKAIFDYSNICYRQIDDDMSGDINYEEFENWIKNN